MLTLITVGEELRTNSPLIRIVLVKSIFTAITAVETVHSARPCMHINAFCCNNTTRLRSENPNLDRLEINQSTVGTYQVHQCTEGSHKENKPVNVHVINKIIWCILISNEHLHLSMCSYWKDKFRTPYIFNRLPIHSGIVSVNYLLCYFNIIKQTGHQAHFCQHQQLTQYGITKQSFRNFG